MKEDKKINLLFLGWIVEYVDTNTGTIKNATLPSGTNSFAIRNLVPGQRYRVKLYAIVDGQQVEV